MAKSCPCGKLITDIKPYRFERTKYCSLLCKRKYATRKSGLKYTLTKENPTSFKKGVSPWNQGLTIEDERVRSYIYQGMIAKRGKHYSPNTEFKYKNGNGYRHLLTNGTLKPVCASCFNSFSLNRLHIHHLDKDRKNNSLSNLQVLCRPCHLLRHGRKERTYTEGRKAVRYADPN